MPPKFTPQAPQVGRYWPGKPLKDEQESSDEEDEEDEMDEEEEDQARIREQRAGETLKAREDLNVRNAVASKLVTTMKTTSLSEEGPYVGAEEEESSESGSEEEESSQPQKQTSKIRQAHRRAIGDFVSVDKVDLEEEDEEEVHCP